MFDASGARGCIDAWCNDDEDCDSNADAIDVIVNPPPVEEVSDEEDFDENVIDMNDNNNFALPGK